MKDKHVKFVIIAVLITVIGGGVSAQLGLGCDTHSQPGPAPLSSITSNQESAPSRTVEGMNKGTEL